jgi:hypothetical protein
MLDKKLKVKIKMYLSRYPHINKTDETIFYGRNDYETSPQLWRVDLESATETTFPSP